MRVLITGASGFVGRHLCQHLMRLGGYTIWGMTRERRPDLAQSHPGVRWLEGSYCETAFWQRSLLEVRPEVIYHLAGQSQVALSWAKPVETMTANALAQIYMLEAVRELPDRPVILVVGSSEEYGLIHPGELPVREENPFRPLSPYAVSKVTQDLMAYEYFRSYGLRIIRTRSFNHTGPGRPEAYAISNFCKQIATIEAHRSEPVIHVGNLKVQRDCMDVRDMVAAYVLATEKGEPGDAYNICTGEPRNMESILKDLLALSFVSIRIQQDPDRLRPADLPIIYGDASKFRLRTGWAPHIPLQQTLQDLLADWRVRVKTEPRE